MRTLWIVIVVVAAVALATPALAQATNPYDVSWAALDPGNDWAAQVLRSLFPIPGGTAGTSTGSEATVIQQIVGQFTGFVAAIACAFVIYNTVMSIHRAAETSRILGSGQTWMFVVRVGFAGIMMFPLGGGFSAGQELVMQGAMVGVGMAKALYANAIQAVGPDAIVVAQPMIPGTEQTVAGLIDNELCMDLVNLASNTGGSPLVPTPQAMTVNDNSGGGYVTWRYSLSTGNESGDPACGTVTVREPGSNETNVAGVSVDMAAIQEAGTQRRAQRLDPQPGRERRAKPLAEQNGRLAHAAARHLQQRRQRLHPGTDLRCHQHPERNQRSPAEPGSPGPQWKHRPAERRGAAIHPRMDCRRRLLPRNRQGQRNHPVPAERNAGHDLADL